MNTITSISSRLVLWQLFFLFSIFFVACIQTPDKVSSGTDIKPAADSIVAFNHEIVRTEMQEIDDFINRYHWEMTRTETGLRYMIYNAGKGPFVKKGDLVELKYKISLLNGDVVGSSESSSTLSVEIGKRNVVSGLEEGLMFMNKGTHAKLIVPSHLAYGLLGDMAKIPARAALVIDVELCSVRTPKK